MSGSGGMRLSVDTGGTFTDLVLESPEHGRLMFKASTTPDDPVRGVLDVIAIAAGDLGLGVGDLLAQTGLFFHATTHAINAVLTQTSARTAFLTTEGHPDILVFREGGREDAFDFTRAYPEPYVPRRLTFEVPERITASGSVARAIDREAVERIARELVASEVEAAGVCLLWSFRNPAHELVVREVLERIAPGLAVTLSHELNPIVREYRRASSTVIDASLKPLMSSYLGGLERRLKGAGFAGRLLMVTSSGGVLDADQVARTPIHAVNSGPSMAPVAGRHHVAAETGEQTAIVADTGGTTYDLGLVRGGRIPFTQETWIGPKYMGHMTGFPSVDVKSIGAGGGSIAWVDDGGLLRVGPQSAGAVPGPACYGRGGERATVTDAALVLGYLDPGYFLGGALELRPDLARDAVKQDVGAPLELGEREAAAAVMQLATEQMVQAIESLTLEQGIDPAAAVLVGGGGAAGLNVVAIARRLGARTVLIPEVAPTLSAAGALLSDLRADFATSHHTESTAFDVAGVAAVLRALEAQCRAFADGPGAGSSHVEIEFSVAGRYRHQVWELDLPLPPELDGAEIDADVLRRAFDTLHEETFAIGDPAAPVEFVAWRATVRCRLPKLDVPPGRPLTAHVGEPPLRTVTFPAIGTFETPVWRLDSLPADGRVDGPAIVESANTSVVVEPGVVAHVGPAGGLLIDTGRAADVALPTSRMEAS